MARVNTEPRAARVSRFGVFTGPPYTDVTSARRSSATTSRILGGRSAAHAARGTANSAARKNQIRTGHLLPIGVRTHIVPGCSRPTSRADAGGSHEDASHGTLPVDSSILAKCSLSP